MATKIHWNELVYGKAKDPNDPSVYKHVSLIAILAWVGLGADGLSSACYGPAATFRALGDHRYLAPYLALATVITVSILSAAYSSTIHAFPSGGGGYTVATRTLGKTAGMICGCALVLDYILTAGISVAAGADAIFALLPPAWIKYKLTAAIAGVGALMVLNFRGVKESIKVLLPVFVLFLVTHAILIALAIFRPAAPAVEAAGSAPGAATALMAPLAFGQAFKLLLMAFSRGAGTYTGIEAISNSLTILREPRVQTARRAMIYMAASLSLVAGGLLLGYLHMNVSTAIPEEAKTLNATLAESVFGTTGLGGILLKVTMVSEALLLVIAAQAGFIDGPRVLASMAVDSWAPRWFSRLSDSLTVSRGILFIGLGGMGAILVTRGKVEELVVVYSFCVFVTFLFSQTGMVRYWFTAREPGSIWRGLVSVLAALVSATILGTLLFEYGPGMAGLALASILVLGAIGVLVRWHYGTVFKGLKRLDMLLQAAEADPHRGEPRPMDKNAPTAVFLVSGYNGAGMHTVMGLQRMFPDYFKQMTFLGVGAIDFDRFKGKDEFENLKGSVEGSLKKYEALAAKWGFGSESRCSFGVDVVEQLEELCVKVSQDFPRAIFFCGDLIFQMPSFLTRILHAGTAEELQRRIRSRGLPLIVMPIRV